MKGTGLVYAEHSIVHMIKGKVIARALRAHILTESTLMTLLLTECNNIEICFPQFCIPYTRFCSKQS